MTKRLHWGILGTGNIARQFADGVAGAQRSVLAAVGSRSAQNAGDFAVQRNIPNAHASYDALLTDPTVEAIYLALPNSMHHEWTLKALRAGKHVLCEKPLACNAAQAQEMFDVARQTGRVLIEAFMYRSHPLTKAWVHAVRTGQIGRLQYIRANFAFYVNHPQNNIRFSAALAGGALLDVGCYCVNLARFLAQAEPIAIHATAVKHASGVDESTCATLTFPDGLIASFYCGMQTHADNSAMICGDQGFILVPVPWKPPVQKAEYTLAHSIPPRMENPQAKAPPPRQTFHIDAPLPLYALEADDFAAAVFDGSPPVITPEDSLGNLRVLDEIRRLTGC